MADIPPWKDEWITTPPDTGGSTDSTEPDPKQFQKNKFPIGGDAIDYYTKSGEKDKVFIPEAMLDRLTLLSPKSAAALMDKLQ